MKQVNRPTSPHRQIALVITSIVTVLLVACGDVARPGGAAPTATEPIIVNAENIPGAAGVPLGAHTPNSDVTIEVRNGAAGAQIAQLLGASSGVDWDAVREGFEASPAPIGEVVPPTLSSVMESAAHGALGAQYAEHFGTRVWLQQRALDAITGSGTYEGDSESLRSTDLAALLTIELPLAQALFAVEAGERLTDAGDLDSRFGAPHEWDRLWAIIHGAPALGDALDPEAVEAISLGALAAASGNVEAAEEAHDVIRVALVGVALETIALFEGAEARAALRAIEPLVVQLDRAATEELAALLESNEPLEDGAIRDAVAQLAERAGIDPSLLVLES